MDHFKAIYSSKASQYHRMIAVEDVDGNLPAVLDQITNWTNARVIDLGSGTGRFPHIMRRCQSRFLCVDLYRDMLLENRLRRDESGGQWPLIQADMRALPFAHETADITIAGWSIGHLRAWYPNSWELEMGAILREMDRVTKQNGTLIICETMSTGSLIPHPPTPELAEYYNWLENKHNFTLEIVPTDYKFASVDQAVEYTEFFFGPEMSGQIRENRWSRLPEWTGIWYKTARML